MSNLIAARQAMLYWLYRGAMNGQERVEHTSKFITSMVSRDAISWPPTAHSTWTGQQGTDSLRETAKRA